HGRACSWPNAMRSAIVRIGSAENHYDPVDDPYCTAYHAWNDDEIVYYRHWSNQAHSDANRDFRKLPPNEQKEYWTWRHNHDNHDHDRDRDRDQDRHDKGNR